MWLEKTKSNKKFSFYNFQFNYCSPFVAKFTYFLTPSVLKLSSFPCPLTLPGLNIYLLKRIMYKEKWGVPRIEEKGNKE